MSRLCILAAAAAFLISAGCLAAEPLPEVSRFNYVVGTQTIGAKYQFTSEPQLVETAQAILDMGSNTIKFAMGREYVRQRNVKQLDPRVRTLTDLASIEPAHKKVLDMPFAFYLIWAYPFDGGNWRDGLSKEEADREYREIYDFARYLLRTYDGAGKTFLFGHWEGDWAIRGNYKPETPIPPAAISGMIDWLNTRQRAVDDAKRDTPHKQVEILNYVEVNLVQYAMTGGQSVTTDVLPKTTVDMVSYSAYDSLKGDIPVTLKKALDFIESKLPPKRGAGIGGKRIFIGEYGFPKQYHTPEKQAELSRQVMLAGIEWGCPFVLYWEMYCNEIQDGKHRGFWMIDDRNQKQPVYFLHQRFYGQSRKWVTDFAQANGRIPSAAEFRAQSVDLLRKR